MKLAIADPPYLGRAEMFYGTRDVPAMKFHGTINQTWKADRHPDAHLWDNPETHHQMVTTLTQQYDGWAIALLPKHLATYLPWVPADTRIAVWHDPAVMPTGSHPRRKWEPVLIYVPPGRRKTTNVPHPTGDVLTIAHQQATKRQSFAGRKPTQWTRWVLDMLGYDQETDTVTDLFTGSGAVTRAITQLTFPTQ